MKRNLQGFYEGIVEDNRDPAKLGRVKIRIPFLHGNPEDPEAIKTEDLPWAAPGMQACASYDAGTFLLPQIGSLIYISFLNGDSNNLIYFGCQVKQGAVQMNKGDKDSDYMGGEYKTPTDIGAPKDVYGSRKPTDPISKGVIFKSPKGATVCYDDTDNAESFSIIDRLGQIIYMNSPVSSENNKGNKSRRGTASALSGNQLDSENAFIKLQSKGASAFISPTKIVINIGSDTITMTGNGITIDTPKLVVNTPSFDVYG